MKKVLLSVSTYCLLCTANCVLTAMQNILCYIARNVVGSFVSQTVWWGTCCWRHVDVVLHVWKDGCHKLFMVAVTKLSMNDVCHVILLTCISAAVSYQLVAVRITALDFCEKKKFVGWESTTEFFLPRNSI